MERPITVLPGELNTISIRKISEARTAYREIPGLQSHTPGEATVTQRNEKAFEGHTSRDSISDIPSITLAGMATPHHDTWVEIDKAARARELLWWQVLTQDESFYEAATGNTVKIPTSGVCDFTRVVGERQPDFTDGEYSRGMTIELLIGATPTAFVIDKVDEAANTCSVTPVPTSPQALSLDAGNTVYEIKIPQLALEYRARPAIPMPTITHDGDMAVSFSIFPRSMPSRWKLIPTV